MCAFIAYAVFLGHILVIQWYAYVFPKKHMFVFQVSTFMRVPQVNVYVCSPVPICACRMYSFSRIHMCVPRVYTYLCLNWTCVFELPM